MVVVNGGVVARVAKQALVIGRAEECALVLGDISVSRHCSKPGALHVVTPEYLGVKGDQYGPPDLRKKDANGDCRCEWCRWHPESGHFRIG